jgi:hypothetical protein
MRIGKELIVLSPLTGDPHVFDRELFQFFGPSYTGPMRTLPKSSQESPDKRYLQKQTDNARNGPANCEEG